MSATQQLPHLLGAWALDSEEAAAAQLAEVAQHAALGPWARDEAGASGVAEAPATLPPAADPQLSDAELAANQAKAEAERATLAAIRERARELGELEYADLQELAKAQGLKYVGVSKADLVNALAVVE